MVEKFLSYLPSPTAPGTDGGMVLGHGSRLPGADDLADASALEQSHSVGHYLRSLVERFLSTAQCFWRRDVHAANCARSHRAENQRALRNSGARLRGNGACE